MGRHNAAQKAPLLLGRFQQVGNQVAQTSPFKVRPLLQVLDQMPRQGGCNALRFAAHHIQTRG